MPTPTPRRAVGNRALGTTAVREEANNPGCHTGPNKRAAPPLKVTDAEVRALAEGHAPMHGVKARAAPHTPPPPPTACACACTWSRAPRATHTHTLASQVHPSTLRRALKRVPKATTKKPQPTDKMRVDAASLRTVEKMFTRMLSALVCVGILTYTLGTNWPVFVPGREKCWASFDETDIKLIAPHLKVICFQGDEPKSASGLDTPNVKISAVLGSRADGEPLAFCLIIKVCVLRASPPRHCHPLTVLADTPRAEG